MKRIKEVLLVMTLVLPISLIAQDTFSKTTSNLTFENSSEVRYIETYVTEGSLSLHVKMDCELKKGGLLVEITNKESGKNYGSFSIGGSISEKPQEQSTIKEDVTSTINKVINNPRPGYYRIKINAQNAEAKLSVSVEQFYKQQ